MRNSLIFMVGLLGLVQISLAELSGTDITVTHAIKPDVVYHTAGGVELKLDIVAPRENIWGDANEKKTVPTLVYFHGGGWMGGSKDDITLQLIPYLAKGWAAVAVQYRLGGTALAPAAVEDTRCAVWWVKRHAEEYGFDPDRIVLTGQSAGGHLALITGMLPASAGFDNRCPGAAKVVGNERAKAELPELNVAAVINWAGITDVADLIAGPNIKNYAVMWLGALENRQAIAQRVSPVHYVRKNLPPILTLHGDKDRVVPYEQAVRLHKMLDKAGAPNQLYTLKGREHFIDFTVEDAQGAFKAIDAFLANSVK